METDDNEKGAAGATNRQGIIRDIKSGDEIIKKAGTRDGGKIGDIKERIKSS